jgi:ribosomal protein S18 acetylase RimI-like enzyme
MPTDANRALTGDQPRLQSDTTMSLPILHSSTQPTPQDLVRFFHQTERDWTRHAAEETPLEIGTAFHNAQLAGVWDANCMLDAALPEDITTARALEEAQTHFRSVGSVCHKWVMNPSAPSQSTQPLIEHLLAHDHRLQRADIMYLAHMPTTPIREVGGLKIIPARASFRHARQLAEEDAARWNAPSLADERMMHLDDPHFDAVLALKDGQAIATAGVLAVGEIGRIEDVFVSAKYRRLGLGRTMMSRALEICARSLFKHVLLSCASDNVPAKTLYGQLGFTKIGEFVEYIRP